MNDPSSPLETSSTIAWPKSLVVPIAITLVLLAFFTTLELPGYVHGKGIPRSTVWIVLASYATAIMAWLLVETKSTRLTRASIDRPGAWFRYQLKRLPLFVVFFIAVGYGLRLLGFFLIGFGFSRGFPFIQGLLFYEAIKAALLYCCWLGLAFGVLSFARMRRQTEHLLAIQKSLVEAKLTHLQGQLRPHFLFNALNTISALMQVDVARADRLLTRLGDLLRANLSASERNTVALGEELTLLRQYAAIMEERFAGRVSVEWIVGDDVSGASVPTMLLQPLLENAFKHGVERTTGSDRIQVSATREADTLRIRIKNANSTLASDHMEGWGLKSCRERLYLLHGELASLTLTDGDGDGDGDGVAATVTLPWIVSS